VAEVNQTTAGQTNRRYKCWRRRIFAITWLAYAGFYLTRKSFSVAKIGLEQAPRILLTKSQMGLIDGLYLAAYAIGQFIWGILGDRLGTRKVILVGMFVSIIAGLAMGASSTVLLLGGFFFIQGLCQSSGWAPLAKNLSYFFSQKERGVVMGWWCTNYAVGGLIASPFAGYCADYFGGNWRYAFYGPAATLFVIWVLFLLLQKNRPEDVGLPTIEEHHHEKEAVIAAGEAGEQEPEASWKPIIEVLKNRVVWILGLVYFCLKPSRYAILFWAPMYIKEHLGTGMTESAIISVCFELGGPVGVVFGGYVSDRIFGSRRMPISVLALFALGAMLLVFDRLAGYHSKLLIAGLLFAIGFLLYIPDSLVSGTAAVDFGTKKGASTASGFINGCGSVAAVFGGALPGWVSQNYGWGWLFGILAGSVCVAGIVLLPLWNALPTTANGRQNSA
jgi:OPA family sugar phosphate sensor protein UhpC-like MFS transporter